jgi:hypothetical protein
MKSIFITALGATLFFAGCRQPEASQQETATELTEEHHHDADEAIVLNNGERWTVDENMMAHIRSMESEVEDFSGSAVPEYKMLAESLAKKLDLLTSDCTMKGQAHDELHKWLLPFIDLVDVFSKSETEQVAQDNLQEIKASFVEFNKYFQ